MYIIYGIICIMLLHCIYIVNPPAPVGQKGPVFPEALTSSALAEGKYLQHTISSQYTVSIKRTWINNK